MSSTVHVNINSSDVIAKRLNLDPGGAGDLFVASEAARLMDPYIPFRDGPLKDTKEIAPGLIKYVQPYAARWFYTHKGDGMRGPHWDQRMLADQGAELVASVATYLGGKPG